MKVSVIVPMRNEAANIERTLASIRRAADAASVDHEIIVIDNGSVDGGGGIAERQGARVVPSDGASIAALRNLGAELSDGECLAFVDADMEMPEQWLRLWMECTRAGRADLLAMVHVPPAVAPWYARIWGHRILAQRAIEGFRDHLPSANLCMLRRTFEHVGGFDIRLRSGEDKDFTLRLHAAGYRLLSLPSPAAIHWGYEKDFGEWVRKEFWRQSSHGALLAKGGFGKLRLLRFPLVAVGHWVADILAIVALLAGAPALALACLALSLLPSLLITFRHPLNRSLAVLPRMWFMHWLRFHIGGVAVVTGLMGLAERRVRT